MPERASHPYLAVAVAGVSALALRFGLAWILRAVLLGYYHAYEPFFRPLPPGLVLILLLVPCGLAVWLSRLYEAPIGMRIMVALGVGVACATANAIVNGANSLGLFGMLSFNAMLFVLTALGYLVLTGLIAGVVGLLRSKLSRPAESS